MFTYVIARYDEDVSWCNDLDSKFIVQKGEHMPNRGREAGSYLWYIINHYDSLQGTYGFRQARCQDHRVSCFDHVCDHVGAPHHGGLEIKELADEMGLDIPEALHFTPGAQFDVTAEQIKQRPLSWYQKLYDIIYNDEEPFRKAYMMERLWKYVFNL